MNSFFLCATQPGNLGDLVINKMLVDELCRYGRVFVDAYNIPESFKKYLFENPNVVDVYSEFGSTLKRFQLIRIGRIIKRNQICLYTNSPGPLYLLPSYKQIVFRLMHRWIQKRGANVIIIGGCCSTASIRKQKLSYLGVSEYYLRSNQSVEYLRSLFKSYDISYIPDLSLLLKYRIRDHISPKNKSVAITFRTMEADCNDFRDRCLGIVHGFLEMGYEVVLFWQVAKDESFMRSLFLLSCDSASVTINEGIVWYDNMSFYSDKQFVVSNRLHALLIGSVYNAIPVVFGDDSEICSKIGHVFSTIFCNNEFIVLPEDWDERNISLFDVDYMTKSIDLEKSVEKSASLCRDTIERIVTSTPNQ